MQCMAMRAGLVWMLACGTALAHGISEPAPAVAPGDVPRQLVVRGPLETPSRDVTELRFQDIHTRPFGPRGLELSEKATRLDGRRVRIVGYMLNQSPPAEDGLFLSPVPATVGAQDEGLADDVPASALFVRLPDSALARAKRHWVPYLPGPLVFEGTLRLHRHVDPVGGRAVDIQLDVDKAMARRLLKLKPASGSLPPRTQLH